MPLKAFLFKGDAALEAALVRDEAHILEGHSGDHVAKIQEVLIMVDNAEISDKERLAKHYGPTTAKAVLNYKKKRNIINTSYQKTADAIVGKMTIKALDDELLRIQDSVECNGHHPGLCTKRNFVPIFVPKPTRA